MKGSMAPTSENIIATLPDSPFEISLSIEDRDNTCETYFYCDGPQHHFKSAIPEASLIFRRALGTMNSQESDYHVSTSESEDDAEDDKQSNKKTSSSSKRISSSSSSSPSSSPSSTPSLSPKSSPRSTPRPITQTPKKTTSRKFLSVPSSLPTHLSTPSKADVSDSGAHTTLAGVSLRKGCTRKAASFGGCDLVKPSSHSYEKKVSWGDKRGSKYQLTHVRLIRPRLATNTSDGTMSTPGHSILRCSQS